MILFWLTQVKSKHLVSFLTQPVSSWSAEICLRPRLAQASVAMMQRHRGARETGGTLEFYWANISQVHGERRWNMMYYVLTVAAELQAHLFLSVCRWHTAVHLHIARFHFLHMHFTQRCTEIRKIRRSRSLSEQKKRVAVIYRSYSGTDGHQSNNLRSNIILAFAALWNNAAKQRTKTCSAWLSK